MKNQDMNTMNNIMMNQMNSLCNEMTNMDLMNNIMRNILSDNNTNNLDNLMALQKMINKIMEMKNKIPEYYNVIHKAPMKDEKLSQNQKNLSLFFNGITDFHKNIQKDGSKIIINYYNLEKIELYLDLDSKVKDLVSNIFGLIFFCSEPLNIYKRTKKNQTTEWITNFPLINYRDNIISKETFILEYKNKNLLDLSDKTGKEIGLKKGEEILLKLNENYYNQLISLPLEGKYLNFCIQNCIFKFPTFIGENTMEFKKRLTSIFNRGINYYNTPLKSETIKNDENFFKIIELCFYKTMTGGGPSIDFVDVGKGKTKELFYSKSAPSWRTAREGLNIFGICENDECKAHLKEVVHIPEMKEHKFNVNENLTSILCPECGGIIKVKTCGFWKCEYQFKGKKIEKGKLIEFDSKPKETKDDKFEYFDPSDNGMATWTELIIYVIPKQKIKYEP